jgi:hypothetical protein
MRMRPLGIELGSCLVLGPNASARSYGCLSITITKIGLDGLAARP